MVEGFAREVAVHRAILFDCPHQCTQNPQRVKGVGRGHGHGQAHLFSQPEHLTVSPLALTGYFCRPLLPIGLQDRTE